MLPLLYVKIGKFCQVGHVLLSLEIDKERQERAVALCKHSFMCTA